MSNAAPALAVGGGPPRPPPRTWARPFRATTRITRPTNNGRFIDDLRQTRKRASACNYFGLYAKCDDIMRQHPSRQTFLNNLAYQIGPAELYCMPYSSRLSNQTQARSLARRQK